MVVVVVVILTIAWCSVLALAGAARPGGRDAAPSIGRIEAGCARLNRLLPRAAVALAVLVAVLSSGRGSEWEARIIAHPEWFGSAVDAESLVDISDNGPGAAAAECRTWIYTCHCMRGLPHAHAAPGGAGCAPTGQ